MYNKILFTLAASLLLNFSFAQNDAAAKKILDAVSSKVKASKGITANFSIKSVSAKGKNNGTKAGTISYKNKKYVLKQGKTEIICDATKTYNYDGKKTLTITNVEENDQTLSPDILFSSGYDKAFTYKLLKSKTATNDEIELTPLDKRKNFAKVTLYIDKAKSMVSKAIVLDKSNNTIEFSLSNLNINAPLNDAIFVYDKKHYPADVEILD